MILRPNSLSRHSGPPAPTPATPALPSPAWLRRAVPDAQGLAGNEIEDVAVVTGAAIGALDAVVRRQERWGGAWRQRLALVAAAVTARRAGRVEDEAALRDAVLPTRPGEDVGPAGRMFYAWRRLAARPAEVLLTEARLGVVLEEFGYAGKDDRGSELAESLRRTAATEGPVGAWTGAYAIVERLALPWVVGSWIADALLAQRLGWEHGVPVLGTEPAGAKSSSRAPFGGRTGDVGI
jgi:hypothetical protein